MSYNNNPYQQAPAAEQGYGSRQPHEMQPVYGQPYNSQPYSNEPYNSPSQQDYNTPNPQQPQSPNVLSTGDFLQRVSAIREDIQSLNASVEEIASLHQRALTSSDGQARSQLDALVAQTQIKNTSIQGQIKTLKSDAERTTDGSFGMKKRQFESLNNEYKEQIQRFLREEQEYRERYREQIARQYRIVNPAASEDEVRQAADADWGNEGVFQTALKSNRSGHASEVLRNVQARHTELLGIERSIRELLDLLNYLNQQILEQGQVIEAVAQKADETETHLDNANVQITKGVEHARRRRRLKWWCALVVFLIIVAIAVGVGVGVVVSKNAAKAATG
ncbi:t-SNARE [Podospora didyma]|uniref:t-SNARE n=1 Tax=Podospora didyma TaxID=330526 RepID=A0AAE0NBG6_9PEZI|nr:t-SNARE [Podospora didyma]